MKINYLNQEKKNWFLISWTLSNKCNYRCSYCPSYLNSGFTGQPQWETVKRFVENFKQSGKHICYRISGGEPTQWRHFLDLAKLVKEQGHTFSFLTNGSKSVEYYKVILQYTDGFILSYHPEYADLKHIINVVKVSNCPVFINLMLKPDNFDEMLLLADTIHYSANNVSIWPKIILDKSNISEISNSPSDYTKEQLNKIKEWPYLRKLPDANLHRGELLLDDIPITANDLIVTNKNRFKNWTCWAGLHMINIDMWGNIYRADCQQGGPLGNLERYQMPTSTINCNKDVCSCLSDIYLRREQ
jgi:organic radical activating enzyme